MSKTNGWSLSLSGVRVEAFCEEPSVVVNLLDGDEP